jgi:hypothetical protein
MKKPKKSVEIYNSILTDELKSLQIEINDAMEYLDKLNVPTNGFDANGKLGSGKRENLSLVQRLTFLTLK